MNYNEIVCEYINKCNVDEPLFLEEIKRYVIKKYKNEKLGVTIKQPKIKINNDNYKYLQLLDIINSKDQITIEIDNEDEIIYKFIEDSELDFEKIIKYARETKNKKILEKLYILAR